MTENTEWKQTWKTPAPEPKPEYHPYVDWSARERDLMIEQSREKAKSDPTRDAVEKNR